MYKPLRYVLRFVFVAAIVASLPVLSGPARTMNSPYLSALSDLTASSVLAINHCNNKACSGTMCAHLLNYKCMATGGRCAASAC